MLLIIPHFSSSPLGLCWGFSTILFVVARSICICRETILAMCSIGKGFGCAVGTDRFTPRKNVCRRLTAISRPHVS
jgi:hypothetical protein